MTILLVLLSIVVVLLVWRHVPISTVDGAIVMAFGILLDGALQRFSFLSDVAGPYLTTVLLAFLASLIAGYVRDAFQGTFYERHLQHPIASFATGTWVAALSVAGVTIIKMMPELRGLAVVLFAFNLLLWSGYLLLIARNYWTILRRRELFAGAHGVLLLACVSTQSIVVTGSSVFGDQFPVTASRVLIGLGLALYAMSAIFIVWRYLRFRPWNLAEHWTNTNCILHGALSITGLACAVRGAASPSLIVAIWFAVFVLFLFVEGLEVLRAIQRVRRYGWKKGLFTYANTQWSRNFTFGMWLAFTMYVPTLGSMDPVRKSVLAIGPYAVILIFLFEAGLFLRSFAQELMEKE
ncbi:MAG: hypothetical protein WCC10_05865 [Tumebacillaceae bacterium]